MYPGVWKGKNVETLEQKVLILGESHYGNPDEVGKVTFTTRSIVAKYLNNNISNGRWDFFAKIAKTFGYKTDEEIRKFYDTVYFGNYVNVVVDKNGEQNGAYYNEKNNSVYNKELFDFCINNFIDIVVCFSIGTYWKLPSAGSNLGEESLQRDNKRAIKIRKWLYNSGTFENNSMILDKDLLVYGICHPSWQGGYDATLVYDEYIKNQQELKWLCC